VAVWYSGVLKAPYMSNEFSKLVSIVATLGSVSKATLQQTKSSLTNPHQNRTTLQVQINQEEIKNISRPQKPTRIRGDAGLVLHGYSRGTSRSEPSPTAAGGPPAMRREIARRGAGRRRGWEEAAPEFGEERELDLEEEAAERGGGGGGGHQRGRKRERKLVGFVVGWVTAM
jgi:hypothetical protein